MKYRIEAYRNGRARLFVGPRAERYLVNILSTKLYETRTQREWSLDFAHSDDAHAFAEQLLPKYAEETKGEVY